MNTWARRNYTNLGAALVEKGYFPKELPPTFSTTGLGKHFSRLLGASTKRSSECVPFHISKPGGGFRRLGIPNPEAYVRLAHVVQAAGPALGAQFTKVNNVSLSARVPDVVRALRERTPHQRRARILSRIGARYKYRVDTDVANFFPSLYTHALAWPLHGKTDAFDDRQSCKLDGSKLDQALRRSQGQRTSGIPTGPDASGLLGELALTGIDHELLAGRRAGRWRGIFVRYVDDYHAFFHSKTDADGFLGAFANACE